MKKIFWKGYFYLVILSYVMVLTDTIPMWLVLLDIGVSIFAIIGLYEYIWGKSILNKSFLKYNFFIQLLLNIYWFYYTWQNFATFIPKDYPVQPQAISALLYISMIGGVILFYPLFHALYLSSFRSKKLG